jgi:tetratricopeptide (TPR) repeat protein
VTRLAALLLVLAACGGPARPQAPRPPEPTDASTQRTPDRDLAAATPADPVAVAGDPAARPGTGAGKRYDLEEIKLVVSRGPGGDERIDAVAPSTLLDQGRAALDAGKPREAISIFRRLAAEFPTSRLAPAGLYYIGMVLEGLGDVPAAIDAYREVVAAYPTGPESLEAHLRIAGLAAERKDFGTADATLVEVLARTDLAAADRLEAQARRGYVLIELGRVADAEVILKAAVATWTRANTIDDHYYIAMAHYYQGELRHREMTAIALRSALVDLKADLVAKENLAAAAYDAWKRALEVQDPYWALAAGYRMSHIFFELWQVAVTFSAGVAQSVEQLICNQQVAGSSPFASSRPERSDRIRAPVEGYPSGQREQTVNLPSPPLRRFESFPLHQCPEIGTRKGFVCGSSSAGRVSAFQAECRGFEPRLPLSFFNYPQDECMRVCRRSSVGRARPW